VSPHIQAFLQPFEQLLRRCFHRLDHLEGQAHLVRGYKLTVFVIFSRPDSSVRVMSILGMVASRDY
jgi:hypothetical protein